MSNINDDLEPFIAAKWEMPKPGPLWSWWLKKAGGDGLGLRRWQLWIWWNRRKNGWKRFVAAVEFFRGLAEAPFEVLGGLKQFGGKTARVHGVSLATQYRQLLMLRWRFGVRPVSYYKFMLFRPERLLQAYNFVEEIGQPLHVVYRHSPRTDDERLFLSKEAFQRWCEANDIPTVQNLMQITDGTIVSRLLSPLPATDLFVKPANGIRGIGVSRWRCVPAAAGHRYTDGNGREFCPADFEEFLCHESLERGFSYLVQPVLTNHKLLLGLTNGALATVRLMTVRASGQAAESLMAALRMPTGGSVADNFDGGGVAAPIDLTTGECGPGIRKKDQYPPDTITTHPDTGHTIPGMTIPYWPECVALVRRAHDLIKAEVPVIGWDVAVLEDGPVLIEPNHLPCENLAQMPAGFPLGTSTFTTIVCEHLRETFLT